MQRVFILLVSILFCPTVYAQVDSTACMNYRKGFFAYNDSSGNTVLVHRLKNYQFEKNTVTNVETQFRINWTDSCSYQILQVRTNSKAARKYNYKTMTAVVIDKTDGVNGYAYSCGCKDAPKSASGFMKKLSRKEYYDLY